MKADCYVLLFLLFAFPFQYYAQSTGVRWTGTVRIEERINSIVGTSEMTMSANFSGAVPTLHREVETTDLNFTDDKGTGGVRQHQEVILEGKKIGESNCTGSGKTQLHEVAIDEIDKTYRIEVIGLFECVGQSVNHLLGTTETWNGYVDNGITVPDQPLRDPNVLAGSHTATGDLGGDLGTFTRTFTWNLSRGKPSDGELIVTPTCGKTTVPNCTYDSWLPEPGRDELAKGSVMNISLKLQARGGGPPSVKAKRFEIRLVQTSKEPGVTLNFPLSPQATQLPDLRLIPHPAAESLDTGQTLTLNCSKCTTGEAMVASYDGGGYTILTADAILDDNTSTRVQGNLLVSGGSREIPVPKVRPGSVIANAWLAANGNPADRDDKETVRGNSYDGDGLSAYEEYRGVISEGKYRRLDPQKKELGVALWSFELPLFSAGLDKFKNASRIDVVRLQMNEIGSNRELNLNFATANVYKQFAIRLVKGNLPAQVYARTYGPDNTPWVPSTVRGVVVDVRQIGRAVQSEIAAAGASQLPYTEAEMIALSTAHELAHTLNADHHGEQVGVPQGGTAELDSQPPYRIFDRHRNPIVQRPYPIVGLVGTAGNEESGDLFCIMALANFYKWTYKEGSDGSLIYYQVPPLAVGNRLCEDTSAQGINQMPYYFGAGVRGNCFGELRLKL